MSMYGLIYVNFEIVAIAAIIGLWFIGSILYLVGLNKLKKNPEANVMTLKTVFSVLTLLVSILVAVIVVTLYIIDMLDGFGILGSDMYIYSDYYYSDYYSGYYNIYKEDVHKIIACNFEMILGLIVTGTAFIGSIISLVLINKAKKAAQLEAVAMVAECECCKEVVEGEVAAEKVAEETVEEDAPQKSNNEAKLASLKEMLDNGLITEEEYKEMCKSYEA